LRFFKKKFLIIAFLALGLGLFLNLSPTQAAMTEGSGLIISPPLQEKTLKPGESFSGIVKVTNPTKSDLTVDVSAEDFKAKGEEGGQEFVEIKDNTSSYSLASWLQTEGKFTLKSGQTHEVAFKITIPAKAEPGGHYGVLFFSPTASQNQNPLGSGAVILPKIGALFLITVPGPIKYDGKIIEFAASQKIYLNSKNKIDFLTRFENLSSVHVKPTGPVILTNTFGQKVGEFTVNQNLGNVLPESIRKFTNTWEKSYGFGFYKAKVDLTFAEGKTVSTDLTFYLVPWKETAGGILLIIVLIWAARHIRWKKR